MIYIVSGFPRSGTSMMMRALEAGGIEVARDKEKEEAFQKRIEESGLPGDKNLNPNGYYELPDSWWDNPTYPRKFDGKAVKVLSPWIYLPRLAVHNYRVIIMQRDPQEIALSMATANGGALVESDHWRLSNYASHIQEGVNHCQNRKDVISVAVVDYEKTIKSPVEVFRSLRDQGWPLDVEKAAATIDPKLYRQKYKDLDDVKEQFAQMIHKHHDIEIGKARYLVNGDQQTVSIDPLLNG